MKKNKLRDLILGIILNILVIVTFFLVYYAYIIKPNMYSAATSAGFGACNCPIFKDK